MSELKKCPCCPDGKGKLWAAYDGTYCVQCDKCGLTTLHKFSKQDVIAAWNRRAQPENGCEVCNNLVAMRYETASDWSDDGKCVWDTNVMRFCPECGKRLEVKHE